MTIYILAGRRPDPEDAPARRFPLENRDMVGERIGRVFEERGATDLIASAACGADLIALDVAQKLGIERHVVLPFDAATFRTTSVIDRPGDWGDLYDRTIEQVQRTGRLHDLGLPSGNDDAYRLANNAIVDTAEQLSAGTLPICMCLVWEGAPRGAGDISYDMAQTARGRDWPVDEVLTI
ncbi:hypothetical protein [Hoeflea sp.]|uniref:hypothetical protein n=1 Tax=Hoeflea sp. TaxID=1940281 RepID=UPI003B02240D